MSRIRRAFVAVVSVVILATAVGSIVNRGSHHHPPVRPAGVVRSVAPAAAAPSASPSADFNTDAFLALLTRIDPTVANQLIGALSSADRAVLATDLETRTGLAAG